MWLAGGPACLPGEVIPTPLAGGEEAGLPPGFASSGILRHLFTGMRGSSRALWEAAGLGEGGQVQRGWPGSPSLALSQEHTCRGLAGKRLI